MNKILACSILFLSVLASACTTVDKLPRVAPAAVDRSIVEGPDRIDTSCVKSNEPSQEAPKKLSKVGEVLDKGVRDLQRVLDSNSPGKASQDEPMHRNIDVVPSKDAKSCQAKSPGYLCGCTAINKVKLATEPKPSN